MKIFLNKMLPPTTFQVVNAVACCLIDENNEVSVKINGMLNVFTVDEGVAIFLKVLKWLGVDKDLYHVSGNQNVILFINGSKIIFHE